MTTGMLATSLLERLPGEFLGSILPKNIQLSALFLFTYGSLRCELVASTSKPYEVDERAGGWDVVLEGAVYS
jgi:hypothetical protein